MECPICGAENAFSKIEKNTIEPNILVDMHFLYCPDCGSDFITEEQINHNARIAREARLTEIVIEGKKLKLY